MINKNHPCEICNTDDWEIIYEGRIRDGVYGKYKNNATVAQCLICGVQRLKENYCIPAEYYASGEYRNKLQQSLSNEKAMKEQEHIQKFMIDALGGIDILCNKSLVDVGCGAGSLLKMTNEVVEYQIGIEPCKPYFDALQQQGYKVYSDLSFAIENNETLDWALSSQVIEHVEDPMTFLKEIFDLLKPGGQALISTPNRDDILTKLLPQFNKFFYRSQHRWYFDKQSIEYCARKACFDNIKTKYIQRYGMANALHWLRDCQPKGNLRLNQINESADMLWAVYLQDTGQADNLFVHLTKPI